MFHKTWLFFVPLLLLGVVSVLARPAAAGSPPEVEHPQVVYQTPTALPDGRVIYKVQEGDSCLRIQLLTGTTIEQIMSLNKLDQDCTIRPDQDLILLIVTPQPSPTGNLAVSPTPLLPTTTPFAGNAEICVLLFNDINGDSVRELDESPIGGGAVSITSRVGQISETVDTAAEPTPVCSTLPEGSYNITMAIPGGYNATTELNKSLEVLAGDQHTLEFGAQISTIAQVPVEEEPASTNPLLAVMGGVLVMGGLGLGAYVLFTRRG